MTAQGFLEQLSRLGAQVQVIGNEIKLRAPRGRLTAEIRADLAAHKQELIDLLMKPKREPVRPMNVLACCPYGCLTRGGLRDQLVINAGCTREETIQDIEASEEMGLISKDEDGLYRIVH